MNLIQLPSSILVGDRYQIERLLGQGGMGRTYLAIDKQNNHHSCVLKEFCPSFSEKAALRKAKELFLREAKILQTLSHPQIPNVLDQFEDQGRLFLIQDYIAGQDYWKYLQNRSSGLTEAEIRQFLQDILPVITYIHQQGVIHRDIAPDNIMLPHGGGKPMLIDFGAVKEVLTHIGDKSIIGTKITKEGYCASEQALGKVSIKSDLYSLGVTAIVLLTQQPPQVLQDIESMEWKWRNFTDVSDELATILDKMLQYNPSDRYKSAEAILNALTPHCKSTEVSISPITLPQPNFSISLTSPLPFLSRSWIYGMMVIIMGFLAGSYSFFKFLPYFPQFCHLSNYCISEERFAEQYYQYNQEGLGAIAGLKLVENRQDLAIIEERLDKTVDKLSVLPSDNPIFPQVESTIERYQQVQQQVSARLTVIEQAEMSFEELEATELDNEKLTKEALSSGNIKQMEKAKRQWQDLQKQYQNIPDDQLLRASKQRGIENTNSRIKQIQTRINQRIAEIEAARREAIRLEQERLRKEREEAFKQQINLNPLNTPKIELESNPRQTPTPHASPQTSSGWGSSHRRIW